MKLDLIRLFYKVYFIVRYVEVPIKVKIMKIALIVTLDEFKASSGKKFEIQTNAFSLEGRVEAPERMHVKCRIWCNLIEKPLRSNQYK